MSPTHGSLTKAGKVRSATPKIPPKGRKSPIPRRRVVGDFEKRFIYGRKAGQFS